MGRKAKTRSGFALLLALLVLALAGTLLASAARQSTRQALAVIAAREDLQRKWAVRSAEAAALGAAERWLTEDSVEHDAPRVTATRHVTLGEVALTLVAGDEQAKANVNLLAERKRDVAHAINRLRREGRSVLKVELAPSSPRPTIISAVPRRYQAYGQVFAGADPAMLLPGADNGRGITDRVTCWGSGRVNICRADPEVMRVALAGVLIEDEIARLVRFREETADCTAAEVLRELEIPEERRQAAEKAVTDTSRCHSLWTVARGRHRAWVRLDVVQTGDPENDAGRWTFEW